jgi:hypothetical protein
VADNRQPHILVTLYQNLYKEKYGKDIIINRFREKWAMQDVIDSVGFDKAYKLVNYYFSLTKPGHPLQFFYMNFDKIERLRTEIENDKESRKVLLESTKKMVEESQ